jgi:hypothetical protein
MNPLIGLKTKTLPLFIAVSFACFGLSPTAKADGGFSYNGMVVDRFGNFYGATVHGGTDDDGCVYKFTP